jgi:hypothetical protein
MLPMAHVTVIMYSIHAVLGPRFRKRSVNMVYGALKGFMVGLRFSYCLRRGEG